MGVDNVCCPTVAELPPPPEGKIGWPWTEGSPHLPDFRPDGSAWPRVSVITPSYNQGRFIEETIRSIVLQGYPNLEYIVMDGGSSDESVDVIRKYERWIDYWESERDGGPSDAINKGWSRSSGAIVAWLNSDDTYLPGAITAQVSYLLAHPEADVVYGDAVYTDPRGVRVGKYWATRFSQETLLRRSFIPQPTVFSRRGSVERSGKLDTALKFAFDYDYWLRTSLHSTFAYARGEIATYRLHDDSKSVSQITRFGPEQERAINRFFEQPNVPEFLLRKRNAVHADLMLTIGINYARANDGANALRYLRESLRYGLRLPRILWLFFCLLDSIGQRSMSRSIAQAYHGIQSRQ